MKFLSNYFLALSYLNPNLNFFFGLDFIDFSSQFFTRPLYFASPSSL
jgi:hypothetical protein